MLPQIVDAYAHQLRRIQSRTAEFRRCRRMGGHSFKSEEYAYICQSGIGCHTVYISRMPGECHIQTVKNTVSGHDGLAVSLFLAGTSEENHRSLSGILLQISLDRQRCRQGSRSQKVVAAAVAVRIAVSRRRSHGAAAFLGQLRKSVILCQKAYHRLSLSILSLERRGHSRQAHLHLETFFFQNFFIELCRPEFMKAGLRKIKDLIAYTYDFITLRIHSSAYKFSVIHAFSSFLGNDPPSGRQTSLFSNL